MIPLGKAKINIHFFDSKEAAKDRKRGRKVLFIDMNKSLKENKDVLFAAASEIQCEVKTEHRTIFWYKN